MLDVVRLRVLAAVAEHGSVTAAAKALHYAQPSVSHHLARLEAETGAVLVQRVGRGIRLTEAGRLLAGRAAEILGRLDATEEELAAHVGLRTGRVRLAAFPSALGTFVPTALAAFAERHPAVEVSIVEAEPPEAFRLLRTGEVETAIAFRHGDCTAEADLVETPLLDEPRFLVRPTGDILPNRGQELSAYADQRWIAGCERCRDQLLDDCRAAGFSPRIAFTTDDYVAVQNLVAAGLGVSTLPALALAASTHPGVVATRIPGRSRHVFAAGYGDPPGPPASAALIKALVKAASGQSLETAESRADC